MSADRPPVLCIAGDDYWVSNPHSRYHIAHALHRRGHRVLWVSNIGMNVPSIRKKGFTRRVLLRLRSWTRWLRQPEPGFWVMTPIALPLFGNRALEAMLDVLLSLQVRLAMCLAGVRVPIIFASIPSLARVVVRLRHQGLIYYYSDKYSAYRDITAREAIERRDQILFESADAIFCASRPIYDDLKDRRDQVHYLPHAVDFRHFNSVLTDDTPPPSDLAAIPHPRIGYFGSMDDSNDFALIRYLAEREPDWQFVFIGRVMGDLEGLERLPNVHTLGFKPYAEMPRYGKGFDVALMFWKMTDWIRSSHPLKTREYLSLGLGVVSVPIEEVKTEYPDLVSVAESHADFHSAIGRELASGDRKREARIARVRGESWDARVEEMMSLFAETRSGNV